jgi:ubiquinone/menaquinone biosynthesis C-methylase UbiE
MAGLTPDPATGRDPLFRVRPDSSKQGPAGRIGLAAASILSALLRFAFHLLYYPLAFTYDAVAWIVSMGEWADWRRCVIPFLEPGPVLEIAHGTGTLSLDMAERGYAVTAIDLSPAMGKIAAGKKRRWLARKRNDGSSPVPALVRADVNRMPLRGGFFSSAAATFPADFLFQARTYHEVHRVLRDGGRWIILPAAIPEFLAKRILADESPLKTDAVWRIVLQQLEECGFSTRLEIVRRPRSRVLIILAEKPNL